MNDDSTVRTAEKVSRWRKRPVVIEAMRVPTELDAALWAPLLQWLYEKPGDWVAMKGFVDICTLEGSMRANGGDWIIRGVKDELYPCKPDIFEATYEPA